MLQLTAIVNCLNSKKWKQLLQSRGRSFIFSTALPVPVAAAAHGIVLLTAKNLIC